MLPSATGDMKLIAQCNIFLSNKYFHIQLNVKHKIYLLKTRQSLHKEISYAFNDEPKCSENLCYSKK